MDFLDIANDVFNERLDLSVLPPMTSQPFVIIQFLNKLLLNGEFLPESKTALRDHIASIPTNSEVLQCSFSKEEMTLIEVNLFIIFKVFPDLFQEDSFDYLRIYYFLSLNRKKWKLQNHQKLFDCFLEHERDITLKLFARLFDMRADLKQYKHTPGIYLARERPNSELFLMKWNKALLSRMFKNFTFESLSMQEKLDISRKVGMYGKSVYSVIDSITSHRLLTETKLKENPDSPSWL